MNQANSAGEETILIVDDEEVNRAILSNLFCTQYTILEAADGLEGLSVIESCGDSLRAILLDVVMPRMDGIQVLRKLHASGLTSRVPVFLITAEAGGSTMREAYELGVMDVIFGLAATSRPAQSSRAGAQRLTRAAHWAVPVGNLSPRTIIRGAS